MLLGYALAAVLGAAVGAVEIFQRYRAEPLRALLNSWGLAYSVFNAGVALCAFWFVAASGEVTDSSDAVTVARWGVLAGLGSIALLRTKLLNLRTSEDKEVAFGPEILVQTFLSILDREIDRCRGRHRFETVRKLMKGIDFERAKLRLPLQIFQALQTVTEEETQALMKAVGEVDDLATLSSQDKAYQLGFLLLDLVGEEFLDDVLARSRDDFAVQPPGPSPPGSP